MAGSGHRTPERLTSPRHQFDRLFAREVLDVDGDDGGAGAARDLLAAQRLRLVG